MESISDPLFRSLYTEITVNVTRLFVLLVYIRMVAAILIIPCTDEQGAHQLSFTVLILH